jgi:shikimate kinase
MRSNGMLISLIGLPGSGKSTVGRQLARRLQVKFVDSDHELELRVGCSVREFFDREGEERFRDLEQQIIEELLADPLVGVLSTGGGVVLRETNRKHLRQHARVVYLKSSPEELFRRLRYDTSRPLLQVSNPLARLHELYVVRDPLYRETAHFVIETGRPSVSTLVNMIIMQMELGGGDACIT